jgi:SAM-dependent methyltransferase
VTSPSPTEVAAVFDAAHAEFEQTSPLLWDPIGAATVRVVAPQPGERVLDVCCGAGSSALPAAAAVGATGHVDAIDLAKRLLDIGRASAGRQGLANVEFVAADATAWDVTGYDVVQSVLGVFFLPDMDSAAARLVGLLRPGGRFAATTWGPEVIEPIPALIVEAITSVGGTTPSRPARDIGARLDSPEKLGGWLRDLGLRDVSVTPFPHRVPLDADTAWRLVLATPLRGPLGRLDEDTVAAVRRRFEELRVDRGADTVETTPLIGIGHTAR